MHIASRLCCAQVGQTDLSCGSSKLFKGVGRIILLRRLYSPCRMEEQHAANVRATETEWWFRCGCCLCCCDCCVGGSRRDPFACCACVCATNIWTDGVARRCSTRVMVDVVPSVTEQTTFCSGSFGCVRLGGGGCGGDGVYVSRGMSCGLGVPHIRINAGHRTRLVCMRTQGARVCLLFASVCKRTFIS